MFVQGHVAAGLEEFKSFLPNSSSIARASAASTFFPGRNNWKTRSRALFDLWLNRNRLPRTLHDGFETFCEEQRASHAQALQESDRLTWSKVQEVKATLHHHFVLLNEGHHPKHIVCYCPQFYMRSILTTWDDPATFESLQGSPKHWQQEMLKSIPSKVFRRYAWAINPEAELPRGTVFLKRKKQFQKGRTIISHSGSLCSKLLQPASIVITIMACALCSDAPGMQSMPQLWRSLHRHWSKPSTEPDQEWNDDLAGLFNAVPRQDIVRAVTALTEQFLEQSGCTVLSVDLLSKSGHQRKPRGRTCSSFKRCWVEDIPLIVQVPFSTEIFTAAGKCRLQKEGTCIGNQISPVLSGLPVLMPAMSYFFQFFCGPQAAQQLNPTSKKAGALARPKTTMVPPPRPRPSSAPPARPPRLLRDREDRGQTALGEPLQGHVAPLKTCVQ